MSGPVPEPIRRALEGLGRSRPLLAGVSGGADSMALLAALADCGFRRVTVCHFSHGLRPRDAGREAALVRRAALRFGYGFEHGGGDAAAGSRGRGLEAAARELRFEFFRECSRRARCRRLVLAHHLEDQVETILMNLCRGTGLAGLCGMAPESRRGSLIIFRPFLGLRRGVLREYLALRKVRFAEDPSNQSPDFARNRFRALVLPAIERAAGPGAFERIARAALILRGENQWLESLTPEPGRDIEVRTLRALPQAARRRLVLAWLRARAVPEPGWDETERVLSLLEPGAPARVNLPGGRHARRRSGRIWMEEPR